MVINFFCPRWGFEHINWNTFLSRVKEAGYHGVEWFPYSEEVDFEEVVKQIRAHDLQLCIVMTVTKQNLDFEDYLLQLKQDLRSLSQIGPPLHISAQTGREYYSAQQAQKCIAVCNAVSAETGVPIYLETHRNKWSYAAHTVYPMLLSDPNFLLTLDISHWFCVSESYLEDQQEAVDLAISRARHLHARVGHTQSSQVADPARQEYEQALQEHLKVWDKWVYQQKSSGKRSITITPEFGPRPYLTLTDDNQQADEVQWQQNLWVKDLLTKRYQTP